VDDKDDLDKTVVLKVVHWNLLTLDHALQLTIRQ
jgi:hypothetical protein